MDSWMFYAVLGMLQVGGMTALYKVPASKQIDKYVLTACAFFFCLVVAGLTLLPFIAFDLRAIILALIWGTGYAIMTLMQMHALHKHDTSGVFPFTSLASNVLVIFGGVLLLSETISPLQWVGVAASVFLFIGAYWNEKVRFFVDVLPSFMLIALLSTFIKFVQKAGSVSVEVHNFIFWELFFAFLASLVIMLIATRKHLSLLPFRNPATLLYAFAIGALNFGSTYMIVKALSLGPISLVYVILGLYTFFTTMFAALLFKEKITAKSLLFIALSFLVVLLIKLG